MVDFPALAILALLISGSLTILLVHTRMEDAREELLYENESEDDANNGVREVWTGVGANQEDDNKSSHCSEYT